MKNLLKILNPIIWFINWFNQMSHLDAYQYCNNYDPYDFDKDLKYF